jgi:hypothetical protein
MSFNPLADTTTKLLNLIGAELGNWKGTSEKAIRVEPSNPTLETDGLLCVVSRWVRANPYRSGNLQVFDDATVKVTLIQHNTKDVTSLISAMEKIQLAFNVKGHAYQSGQDSQFFEQCYLDLLVPFSNSFNEP